MAAWWTDPFFYGVLFLGTCMGSFATAVIYRLPRGISIVKKKRSACPTCGHDLHAKDLVPFLSWLYLRGKCRYCRAPIGVHYPLTVLATLLLSVTLYAAYGPVWPFLPVLTIVPVLVSLVLIDLRHKILPDGLNLYLLLAGVAALALCAATGHPAPLDLAVRAGCGLLLYGGGAWLLRYGFSALMRREAMGLGDVKFFAVAGFWLGADADQAALFMLLSGLGGVMLALLWRRVTGEEEFPFGPALILALTVLILWQTPFAG